MKPAMKPDMKPLSLEIRNLDVRYGAIQALRSVNLQIREGELVAVIGSNGAGKTTLLKTISGQLAPFAGEVLYDSKSIGGVPPHRVTALGIAHSPEGRKVFAQQTVAENLILGAYIRRWKDSRKAIQADIDRNYEIFPILRERQNQLAGTLSGGEQQMLAIARALMSRPKLLLLDEPSMGLAPIMINEVFKVVERLRDSGSVSILLVEQLAHRALQVCNRAFVLEQGHVKITGTGQELLGSDVVKKAYLGGQA